MNNLAQLTSDGKGFKEKHLWRIWKEVKRDFQEDVKEGQKNLIKKLLEEGRKWGQRPLKESVCESNELLQRMA